MKGLRPARPKSEGSETGSTLKNEVQTVSTPFFRGSDGLNTIFQGLDRLNLEKGNFSVCCGSMYAAILIPPAITTRSATLHDDIEQLKVCMLASNI